MWKTLNWCKGSDQWQVAWTPNRQQLQQKRNQNFGQWKLKEDFFILWCFMCKLILTALCTTHWAGRGALSIFYLAKPSTTESFLLHIITLHIDITWSRKVDSPAESQLFSISTVYCHNIQLSAHNKPLCCIVQYILHTVTMKHQIFAFHKPNIINPTDKEEGKIRKHWGRGGGEN